MKTFVEPANLQEQYVRTYEVYNSHKKKELNGWLLIESSTKQDHAQGILIFNLSYTYLNINGEKKDGIFEAHYNKHENEVSLTNGNVHLEAVKGMRIGSLLMSCVIEWVRQWPEAAVKKIRLSDVDATNGMSENKNRRNRFYEQFGIEFEYRDDNKISGFSKKMLVSGLVDNKNFLKEHDGNIERIDAFPDYLKSIMKKYEIEVRQKEFLQNKLKEIESHSVYKLLKTFNILWSYW
nr:hypothetical protein [Providencia stuartii]